MAKGATAPPNNYLPDAAEVPEVVAHNNSPWARRWTSCSLLTVPRLDLKDTDAGGLSTLLQPPDHEMSTAKCLLGRKRLLNHNSPDLSIIRDNRWQRPQRLGLGSTDTPLKRVETVLQAIIYVMNAG